MTMTQKASSFCVYRKSEVRSEFLVGVSFGFLGEGLLEEPQDGGVRHREKRIALARRLGVDNGLQLNFGLE